MQVIWMPKAKKDYYNNIDYLLEKWPQKVVNDFTLDVDKTIKLLLQDNLTFKRTNYKDVYQAKVNNYIQLFYIIKKDTIYLLRFWNNVHNPKNFSL